MEIFREGRSIQTDMAALLCFSLISVFNPCGSRILTFSPQPIRKVLKSGVIAIDNSSVRPASSSSTFWDLWKILSLMNGATSFVKNSFTFSFLPQCVRINLATCRRFISCPGIKQFNGVPAGNGGIDPVYKFLFVAVVDFLSL